MGIAHRLLPNLGLTIVMWHGAVTAKDSLNHLMRLAEEPCWPPGLLHLTDMRTVTTVTLPDPELLELLFDGSHWRDEDLDKVVIVAAELLRKSTVEDAASALGMNAHVVGDIASACAHLRIDPIPITHTLEELRSEIDDPRTH
jgi:hypothetical protein